VVADAYRHAQEGHELLATIRDGDVVMDDGRPERKRSHYTVVTDDKYQKETSTLQAAARHGYRKIRKNVNTKKEGDESDGNDEDL